MAGRKVARAVVVQVPASEGGGVRTLLPGDEVPDWVDKDELGDHVFTEPEANPLVPSTDEVDPLAGAYPPGDEEGDGSRVDAADAAGAGDVPPPHSGKGSGKDAWVAYAEAHGVEVDDDASRDEIVDALEAAGVPVD